jgi:hypothetical protein
LLLARGIYAQIASFGIRLTVDLPRFKLDWQGLFSCWCIADTDLALMLTWPIFNGYTVLPRLADYAAYPWQRPTVQQIIALDGPSWLGYWI